MRYKLVTLVAATMILGVGTTTLISAAAFAAESVCEKVQDAKKKEACMKAEAKSMKKCEAIKDATKNAECTTKEAAALEKKYGK